MSDGPEAALWRAVVVQAINDASMIVRMPRGPKGKRASPKLIRTRRTQYMETLRDRDKARDWLTGMSKDFRMVCAMALLDPDAVHDRAERLKASGWAAQSHARPRVAHAGA